MSRWSGGSCGLSPPLDSQGLSCAVCAHAWRRLYCFESVADAVYSPLASREQAQCPVAFKVSLGLLIAFLTSLGFLALFDESVRF